MFANWFMPSISTFNQNQSLRIKQIDLNNYYRHDQTRQIIHCLICNCDVSRREVFEHTVSKRHKYNKLFVAITQDLSENIDFDFIVLNIDRLQCRYCDTLIINSNEDDLVISHIEDTRHIKEKQDLLNGTSSSSAKAATVDWEFLQPLDTLITHDKIYNKRNKSTKKIKKKGILVKKVEMITKELKVTNDDQNDILEYSKFSTIYKREKGEELPECISIIGLATCLCNICLIEIPKSTYNVGGHIDGRKHKRQMQKSMKATCQKLETIDLNKKLLPQPAKLVNYRELAKTAKDSNDVNNSSKNYVSQFSAFLEDVNSGNSKRLADCISTGVNGTRRCTVCNTAIPRTPYGTDQHLNGKKHKAKMGSKLQDANKLPLPRVQKKCKTCGTMYEIQKHGLRKHRKTPIHIHKEKMLQLKKSFHQTLNSQDSTKLVAASISTTQNGSYMCETCFLMVPNDTRSIELHNNGINHKSRVRGLFGF